MEDSIPMTPAPETPLLFDRALIRRRRARSQALLADHGPLIVRAAGELADRVADFDRRFEAVLLLGDRGGLLGQALRAHPLAAGRVGQSLACDVGPALAGRGGVVADDELLPFADQSQTLVLSLLTLHGVNDLPGALVQMRRVLKPDGLLLAALWGGETLRELREAFAEAEIDIEGGLSPRVSPMTELSAAAGLLQRAGFALPVVDRDLVTVSYPHPLALLHDLRGIGESNALLERRRTPLRRATLARLIERYQARFSRPDGRIVATFEFFYLTGWAPHESQQKPLRPGSARQRLADALGTREVPAGEKAGPPRGG